MSRTAKEVAEALSRIGRDNQPIFGLYEDPKPIVPRNPIENYIQLPYVRSADVYDAIKYLLQHRPRRDRITKVVNLKLDLRVPNGKDIPVEEFLEILFEILSNRLPEGVEVCLETISGEDYT